MAHSNERPLKVEYLSEFKSIVKTALDHKSRDQIGTFGEITLDKKNLILISLLKEYYKRFRFNQMLLKVV